MLDHAEGFELEKEYSEIWDKIRYKKIDELYEFTEKVIKLLGNHIDNELLFHRDYDEIQYLFKKMREKGFFYMSGSAKEIIKTANPKFENIFERRKCVRDLKYIFSDDICKDDRALEKGKIYQSLTFNGATYEINVNGKIRGVGYLYFERMS